MVWCITTPCCTPAGSIRPLPEVAQEVARLKLSYVEVESEGEQFMAGAGCGAGETATLVSY
jgi:hypothetical protein